MFADFRNAPIREDLRAALGLVECLTLRPDEVDVGEARAAGLDDEAIEDVITICSLFNLIVRVADSLGFEVPPPETMEKMAPMLLKRGYA